MTSANLPTTPSYPFQEQHPVHPFTVIKQGWSFWKRSMPAVALITLLLDGAPTVLFATLDGWFDQPALALFDPSRPTPASSRLTQALMPFTLVLTPVSLFAMTRCLLSVAAGRTVTARRSVSVAFGRLPSVIWALLAFGLTAAGLAAVPLVMVVGSIRAGWTVPATMVGVLTFVLILTLLGSVSPALIVDGAHGFQAVRRSWRLARRHLGRSAIVIGFTLVATWSLWIAVQLLSRMALNPDGWGAPIGATIAALIGAIVTSVTQAVTVSLYLRLRAAAGERMSDGELAARLEAFDMRRPPPPPRPDDGGP